jgi:uncharacterized membrane protein YgcG
LNLGEIGLHTITRSRRRLAIEVAGAIALSLAILIIPNTAAVSSLASVAIEKVMPGEANNPSDFDFASFDAAYDLSRDANGRSQLSTTEILVARFPDTDQNTGIVRRIPNFYKGHSTHVKVISVTDLAGKPLEHTVNPHGDYTAVRITDGSYVHGDTTFVVSYEQRDVTASYDSDEFFWDVNGVDWAQSFDVVRARITLDPSLVDALTGDTYCYTGERGESNANCTISVNSDASTIDVDSMWGDGYSRLGARENLTVAVGFEPGTFSDAPLDVPARIASSWYWLGGLSTLGPVISALGFLLLALVWNWNERRLSRPSSTIIAQYEPPQRISVAQAAYLLDTRKAKKRAFAADTVDQVVRKKLILDRRGSVYTVRLADTGESKSAERLSTRSAYREVLAKDNHARQIGGVAVESTNLPLRIAFGALRVRILASVSESFTTEPRLKNARRVLVVATLGGVLLALNVYGPRTGGDASANLVLLWGVITVVATMWALIILFRVHLPTPNTLSVIRILEGLRVYIQLAEQDRLRILQSPDNAEVVPVGENEVVALNEKLLGYAVLFGLEKRWAAEIGVSSATESSGIPSSNAVSDLVSGAGIMSLVAAVSSTTPQSPSTPSSGGSSTSSDASGGGGYSGSSGGSDGGGSSGDGGGGGGGDGI